MAVTALALTPLAVHGASKNWTGGTGNWNNGPSWSPSGVPGNGDDVNIGQNGAVVTYIEPAAVSLNSLHIAGMGSGSSLLQSQDALTTNNLTLGSAVALGTYNFSGGSLSANMLTIKPAGTLTGSALVTDIPVIFFEGGSMSGSGETRVALLHELHLMSADTKNLGRTIRNLGDAYWSGGGVTGSGTFINDGGEFIMTNDGAGDGLAFGITSFQNLGTVTKQSGTASRFGGSTSFDNQGIVQVLGGTRLEFNGPIVQRSGTTLTGGQWTAEGELRFNSGESTITHLSADAIVQLQGTTSIFSPINAITHNGGTFAVSGGRNFTTAGAFDNTGLLAIGGGSTLTVTTSLAQHVAATLTGGSYFIAGTLVLPGGAITTNQADVTLSGASSTFTNLDTLTENQGNFTLINRSFSRPTLNNSGAITVGGTSTLSITSTSTQSGSFDLGATANLTFSGGTHTFNAPNFAGSGNLNITGAANIASAGGWTISPVTVFTGGTLSGGAVTIPSDRVLRIQAGGAKVVDVTINNSGTTTWAGSSGAVSGSGAFNNVSGALFEILNASGPAFGMTQFNNDGEVRKSGAATSNFGNAMTFNNTGVVDVQAGIFNINGAVPQVSGTTLTGGTWKVTGAATLQVAAAGSLTSIGPSATVALSGASSVFSSANTLANNQGSFTITNGRAFTTAGALTNSGTVSVGPSSTLQLSGTFKNTGTLAIDAVGQVNLTNQKMITTDALGSWNGSAYNGVLGQVKAGRIMTTSNYGGLTSVGVAPANEIGRVGQLFGGVLVNSGDVLLAYTLAGDANLSGSIDSDDYFAIDSNYNKPAATLAYHKGDFNLDGVIDGDDFLLIDSSFAGQGGFAPSLALSPQGAGAGAGVTAVPEPMSFASLTLLAAAALRRRRRDRRFAS